MRELNKKIPRGNFVPIIVPISTAQAIKLERCKEIIDFVIEGGVDGILFQSVLENTKP
jgi:dihydrodipicolinate synthase/N-acetylneuraminate lyase